VKKSNSKHPVNLSFHDEAPLGAHIADRVTGFMGSWKFIIIQTIVVGLWVIGNVYLLTKPFDPFPFILLNLAFSTQAAYAAPLILLAGNRQARKDRETLEYAAAESEKADLQNVNLAKQIRGIEEQILKLEEKILDIAKQENEKSLLATLKRLVRNLTDRGL